MAKHFPLPFLVPLLLVVVAHGHHLSNQLPDSQSQSILTIQKLLNFPQRLSTAFQEEDEATTDFCHIEATPTLSISCYQGNITQLHFAGVDRLPPLPGNFSIVALFVALAGLPSLKVLSLASLGIWGPLPPGIGRLDALEILDLRSNYLTGSIPVEFSWLPNIQSVVLDHNMLTGNIPPCLSSSALTVLSLRNNSIAGSLPGSFSALTSLRILDLSLNRLSGPVPDLSNLTNLQVMDLENNSFGPRFPNLHYKLVALVLRGNRFSLGLNRMDSVASSFYHLKKLDVSLNGFVGPFPPALLSLPSLTYLDIAGNKFTGMLLANMSCGGELEFVNLSSNYLTGELPTCLKSNKLVVSWYKGNCLLLPDEDDEDEDHQQQQQRPYSTCHNEALAVKIFPRREKKRKRKAVVAAGIVGGTIGAISLVGLVLLLTRLMFAKISYLKKPRTTLIVEKATPRYTWREFSDAKEICRIIKLGPLGLPAYRNFSLEELKEAAADFSKSNLIGEGPHGQTFRGKLANDTLVAIRSLKMRKRCGVSAYTRHIELLSKLRHSHLVSALGHCFEYHPDDSTVNKIYLIFEFVPNGTLRDWIKGQKLTWLQRLAAAIGVAKGIQFLHTGILPGIFSNNLKMTDVLLDHSLQVKLSRYNLPLLAENREQVDSGAPSQACSLGSKGNPKAGWGKQDEKSDVFDFGVILLENITGRPITSGNEADVVKDLFQVSIKADKIARQSIVDPAVCKQCSDDSLKTLMELCVACLSPEPSIRPSIEDVLWNLHFVAQLQGSWRGGAGASPDQLQGSPIFPSR
ncbi:hypothetical protein Dimus_021896 [Dionaea muscipula]